MSPSNLRSICERAYEAFHRPCYISPDPLEVVRDYPRTEDREVVGLIASGLALGRVDAIVRAVRWVMSRLSELEPSPSAALVGASEETLADLIAGFRYRFFDDEQLLGLLIGIRTVVERWGSLEECFAGGVRAAGSAPTSGAVSSVGHSTGREEPVLRGLTALVNAVVAGAAGRLDRSIMLPRPGRGSACKRLLLFARWMVRNDAIDPGGWAAIGPEELLIPVDAHVLKVARRLGLTKRTQATLPVAREITAAMRVISPQDPVRYDFALTRPGIHPLLDEEAWLRTDCTRSA